MEGMAGKVGVENEVFCYRVDFSFGVAEEEDTGV